MASDKKKNKSKNNGGKGGGGGGKDRGSYGPLSSTSKKVGRRSSSSGGGEIDLTRNSSKKAKTTSASKKNGNSKAPSSSQHHSNSKNGKGNKKTVPKSTKHHTAKPKRTSIKDRVAAAAQQQSKRRKNASGASANGRKKQTAGSSTHSFKGMSITNPYNPYNNNNNSGGGKHNASNNTNKRRNSTGSNSNNNNSSSASKRGRNKGKTKKTTQYQMNFSQCNDQVYLHRVDVPWHEAENQERFRDNVTLGTSFAVNQHRGNNEEEEEDSEGYNDEVILDSKPSSKKSSDNKSTLQLPSETILSQIDSEIHSFGTYVKLTPTERLARTAFLDHVTELAVSQFTSSFIIDSGRRGSNLFGRDGKLLQQQQRGSGSGEEEEIHVASFGSFATQDVCIYASDVDMCLWGVVSGGSAKRMEHIEFIGDHDNDDGSGDDDEVVVLENTGSSGCPLLTESSLLRTMDAIQQSSTAAATASVEKMKPSKDQVKATTKQNSDMEGATPTNNNGNDGNVNKAGDCLFFIDRVGEGIMEDVSKEALTSKPQAQNDEAEGVVAEEKKMDDDTVVKDAQVLEPLDGAEKDVADEKKVDEVDVANEAKLQSSEATKEKETKGKDRAGGATQAADFQFAIDTEGIKQLGGEEKDLTKSPDDAEKARPVSTRKQTKKSNTPKQPDKAVNELKVDGSDNEQRDNADSFEPGAFAALGKSAQDAIGINDNSSSSSGSSDDEKNKNEVIVVDSDDDSADPMSSYYSRKEGTFHLTKPNSKSNGNLDARASPIDLLDDDSSSDEEAYIIQQETLDVSSDNDDDDEDSVAPKAKSEEVLELSITSNKPTSNTNAQQQAPQHDKKSAIGPTGKARMQVVSALQSLTRQLRRSSFTHTIECRSKARVPIINCSTRTGFEGDIAIGGHNGVDTSMYAMSQVKRFNSFAPIILIMKVLMAQQGFDKPFTGGLGSYKLYVLVAYHIECHIANGGADRPSEILISLLHRYGCIGTRQDKATTDLDHLRLKEDSVCSGGGMCELHPVFRLSDCVDMLRECHERILERILTVDEYGDTDKISYLSSIIDCYRLRQERETSDRRAKLCENIVRPPVGSNDPGKVNAGRRIGKVFTKSSGVQINSYKRGSRGSIVPRRRPDLQAKHSLRSNCDAEILQRGMKNRKNNKKQKRDAALTSFASR